MPSKMLYLVDGHYQIYRAYYAPFGNLTSPTGEPTRAIHVFTQVLLNLLRDRKPDYLALVLDVSDETVFRVEIDSAYKANRQSAPEDLSPQFDRIVEIVNLMKIPILRQLGFEADDIMATIARRLAGPDLEVILVSRDKDLDQILSPHIRMYDPAKDRFIDVAALIAEKGYGPQSAIEAQMLIGDSTDNIRGVIGVGPKKAADLLKKYGTVSAIIERADELTPKLRENVLEFRGRMEAVRKLVTLRDDVPIAFDLEEANVTRFDPSGAASMLDSLGLRRLVERVAPAFQPSASPSQPPAPPRASDSLFEESEVDSTLTAVTGRASADYRLIDDETKLGAFAKQLAGIRSFTFDTETNDTSPTACDLVGISISWEPGTGYYIPVRGVGNTVTIESVRKLLGPIFANPRIHKSGQNLKFDISVMQCSGMPVHGADFDTMIASFVLNSARRSHGIDALALELLGYRKIATTDLLGKGKTQTTFDHVDTQRTCQYACEDADIALRLKNCFEKQFTEPSLRKLFDEVEMPLVEVLVAMESRGVALDTDLLAKMSGQMADRLAGLEHQIHEAAGRPFNINSTQQLAEILFDVRKLRVVKTTKTARSTDAEVLEILAAETSDPVPTLLLEYRELAKLKGTYIDALPEMILPRTGRVHPSFNQIGAVTGRLSCSDPNLQNIPIRTDAGAAIRRAFIPGEKDHVLLKADYSQIELRILAHFSKDPALMDAFREDRDVHAFVAAQLAGIPLEQVTPKQRSQAKTVNFGIVYGQSAFGLARQTGMSQTEAKIFIFKYFERYKGIRDFLDECIAHARKHGYVQTLLGRRREIADINSRNQSAKNAAERFAVNTVVQGTAADLIKKAMINIHRRIEKEKRPSRMLIQVHDELVFEVPRKAVKEEARMIAEEMSTAIPLDVPVKVDVAQGQNWLDVNPV